MHAQIVLFDGFDPLDVTAPYEVLYAGGTASGGAVSKVTGQRRTILAATEHRP
jgi:putative intracellular protease/amidase